MREHCINNDMLRGCPREGKHTNAQGGCGHGGFTLSRQRGGWEGRLSGRGTFGMPKAGKG